MTVDFSLALYGKATTLQKLFRVREGASVCWLPRFAACSMDIITQPSIRTTTANWGTKQGKDQSMSEALHQLFEKFAVGRQSVMNIALSEGSPHSKKR